MDVARVGVCGTDVEFFTGEMSYLHDGNAAYPMRLGHEWCGVVSAVGSGVARGVARSPRRGGHDVGLRPLWPLPLGTPAPVPDRFEVGIRGGKPGALAEQLAVPASSLVALPDVVDDAAGAMVEPGANALRAVWGADVHPGDRVLVLGPGTIGTLAAQFARAAGAEVHVLGEREPSLSFARSLGLDGVWTAGDLPPLAFDAVIDASTAASLPALALELVEPGKRVVYIGISGAPSTIDTRTMLLKDVTAVGVLSGSPALPGAVEAYAEGSVDPATARRRDRRARAGGRRAGGPAAGQRRPRAQDPRRSAALRHQSTAARKSASRRRTVSGRLQRREMAGAGDDVMRCLRQRLGELPRAPQEVRHVALAGRDQRGDVDGAQALGMCFERVRRLGHGAVGVELERPPLHGGHEVAQLRGGVGRQPRRHHCGRGGVEVATLQRLALGGPRRLQVRRGLQPRRGSGDDDQSLDALRRGHGQAQRHRAAERASDDHRPVDGEIVEHVAQVVPWCRRVRASERARRTRAGQARSHGGPGPASQGR